MLFQNPLEFSISQYSSEGLRLKNGYENTNNLIYEAKYLNKFQNYFQLSMLQLFKLTQLLCTEKYF